MKNCMFTFMRYGYLKKRKTENFRFRRKQIENLAKNGRKETFIYVW